MVAQDGKPDGTGGDGQNSVTEMNGNAEVVAPVDATGEETADVPVNIIIKTLGGSNSLTVPLGAGDTVMDVRQFLTEIAETCYYTHYTLRCDGVEVNDFTEISSLVPEGSGSQEVDVVLQMTEACYEERCVKAHVRKLREILAAPQISPATAAFALLPVMNDKTLVPSSQDSASKQEDDSEAEESGPIESSSLLPLFEYDLGLEPSTQDLPCLKSVILSPFNPPPPNRKLQGDLAYYDVTLTDDRKYCITACVRGFFVNKTTPGDQVLNATPDNQHHLNYTLVGLLNQISPAFKRNFAKMMASNLARDPFEAIPRQLSMVPWAVSPKPQDANPARVEDSMSTAYGMEVGALIREWNEEHQSSRELPKTSRRDQILRERTIFKISCDFIEAASKGATAVIEHCIPPINPMDPQQAHMYVYNSIFFSYATETKESPSEDGLGDQATYASSNQDLIGVTNFSMTEIDGLYTLATAIIDYRGSRVVAQSIIPGILQGEQLSSLIHGSVDNGKKIVWDEKFHEKVKSAAAKLHIKEHTVQDGNEAEHKVCVPVECKGILGSDNRMYLLDIVRITPHDPNYKGDRPDAGLLRWELVRNFCRTKTVARLEQIKERADAAEAQATDSPDSTGQDSSKDSVQDEASELTLPEPVTLNVNVALSDAQKNIERSWKIVGDSVESDQKDVLEVAELLITKVIPGIVEQFRTLDLSPVDGKQLTDHMHQQGINMRYLGALHAAAAGVPYVQVLCEREMIVRACKHLLRRGLHRTGPSFLAAAIAHFFNCALGRVGSSGAADKKAKKKKGSGKSTDIDPRGPLIELSTDSVWEQLQAEIATCFSFELDKDSEAVLERVRKLPVLRSVSQRVGIQFLARDYDLKTAQPFRLDDIMQLFPVVKGMPTMCKDGHELLAAGKALHHMSNVQKAFDVLHEALNIYHQTCGPMHAQTASCYSTLAMVYYNLSDLGNALSYQQKAIAILEKIHGWDDPEVALGYGNMALFSHCLQHNRRALTYVKRAEYLLHLICGPNHPDVAALYINTAVIHLDLIQAGQGLHHAKTALRYLHRALQINETVLGPDHMSTATTYHATAVALTQVGAPSVATKNEQKCCEILKALFGDEDPRVRESQHWIAQFAAKAKVQAAQQTKIMVDDNNGKETIKPVMFASGGTREAEKTAPAATITSPKKSKVRGIRGQAVRSAAASVQQQ